MSEDILSNEHVKEIGRLVVNVSKLDTLLTDLIATFSGTNILMSVMMVHHQQFANKADILLSIMRAVFQGLGEDNVNQLIEPVVKSKTVSDFRNTVAHALWVIDDQGNASAVRFQARGKFIRSKRPVAAKEIGEQADIAFQLVKELTALREHFRQNIPDLAIVEDV